MELQSKPTHQLQRKLARKQELISKWSFAAQGCDDSNPVGRATKRYCLGLARDAQEKKEQIQAELDLAVLLSCQIQLLFFLYLILNESLNDTRKTFYF